MGQLLGKQAHPIITKMTLHRPCAKKLVGYNLPGLASWLILVRNHHISIVNTKFGSEK